MMRRAPPFRKQSEHRPTQNQRSRRWSMSGQTSAFACRSSSPTIHRRYIRVGWWSEAIPIAHERWRWWVSLRSTHPTNLAKGRTADARIW